MDYLEYFGLTSEPFSHAPNSRFYYSSRQHTDALKRLLYVAQTMKGLAILVGDIGHGKTTLARRMLDALPENEFEAAMLVIVHAGITPNWLLKRIASQLGVPQPADDKLTILSQLYQRLVEIHQAGKRAVVLIDEAQMLASRDLMEEFRGMLNLEVPGHKLISFIFFGLPEIERHLRLDPPLAQRVALRYQLQPLSEEDTVAYALHRLRLANAEEDLFPRAALLEVHRQSRGVPRVINTLCDNVLLELFFAKSDQATPELVSEVAGNLRLGDVQLPALEESTKLQDSLAVPGSAGEDAVVAVRRGRQVSVQPGGDDADVELDADAIAARVAKESRADFDGGPAATQIPRPAATTTVDIDDPLAFLGDAAERGEAQVLEIPGLSSDAGAGVELTLAEPSVAADAAPPIPLPESPHDAVADEASFGSIELEDTLPRKPVAPARRPVARTTTAPIGNMQQATQVSTAVQTPVKQAVASPAPAARRAVAKGAGGSTINLSEIDDLLADLKKR